MSEYKQISYSDLSPVLTRSGAATRRAAIQTAVSAKAAKKTSLIRTMTTDAVSKAGGVVKACHAYAKRAPAASPRICRSPHPGRRDHTVIVITAPASITKKVSVLPTALGIQGATTRMLAAMAARVPTIHADGASREVWPCLLQRQQQRTTGERVPRARTPEVQ